MIDVQLIRNLEKLVPFSRENFSNFLSAHMENIENSYSKLENLVRETELTIFEGMKYKDVIDSAILSSLQNVQDDIDYELIASRLAVTKLYKSALLTVDAGNDFLDIYKKSFKHYIKLGVQQKLLDPLLDQIFDLDELANTLDSSRDDGYTYIGITTLEERYMIKDRNQKPIETPQFTFMRVAMGLALKEKDPTQQAKIFYHKLSNQEYSAGGSTMIGSGSTYPVLSNCYLIDTEDDINSIFDNVKKIALISKATGGIGIAVTKLRASGSPVRSNNTASTGPIPFIKVMDAALKSVSRAGKKAGAMAIYMENWHIDFQDFLDLKQNAGDDYRRIRTADTAVYISDEFMKRLINNDEWFLFDPLEVPELTELYGIDFSIKYNEYVQKAKRGEMRSYSVIPAREQMEKILTSLLSTSHPWLTWKDTINLRALNNNTGTIHCSNLCTEVTLPQDSENIAVCNLLYINVPKHINFRNGKAEIDWNKMKDTVRVGMRHLDNLIDVNMPNVKEAVHSDKTNRAVGMGIMGVSEVFEHMGYAYNSEEAFELMDKIAEFISYVSIDESCNLAEERGSYDNFQGSMWSKGYVPFDSIKTVEESRTQLFNLSTNTTKKNPVIDEIRQKVTDALKESDNNNSSELNTLLEKFDQLLNKTDSSNSNNTGNNDSILTQNRKTRLDWDKLRERVTKGVRNATTMAIAPNANSALVAGTSPGVDPRFSQIFSRSTATGKFLDINHNLVKELKKLELWDKVKEQVLANYGDLTDIVEIPDSIKAVYKTSFQISPYAFIEIASRAQKWIDQAISRNIYLETRDINEMVDIYTDVWRRGVKTTYYLHTKPRHSAEQSTVKVNKGKDINKRGFTSVNDSSSIQPTAQMSMDGKEVKGFGFAGTSKDEENASTPIQELGDVYEKIKDQKVKDEKSKNQVPRVAMNETIRAEPKVELNILEETQIAKENNIDRQQVSKLSMSNACPVDPMERVLCDSCQ